MAEVEVEGFSPYASFRAVRTFSCLDGLRCFSILAVIWTHTFSSPALQKYFPATRLGFLGVDLFFEISGFLIVTLLLRERDRTGSISLRKFYVRRFLRIFPLYYACLVFFALLYLGVTPRSEAAAAFRRNLPALLVYLTNWYPAAGMLAITWSLSAEEQFYIIWPGVEKKLTRAAPVLVLGLILISQAIQFGALDGPLQRWFGWDSRYPPMLREATFTPICLGVLLAHVLHGREGYRILHRHLCGHPASAPLWLAVLVVLCCVLPEDLRGWGRPAVHYVMVLLLGSCVVREDNGLARLLTWRPVARIGVLSYGLYLLHLIAVVIVSKFLEKFHADRWELKFALGTLLSVALAEASYRFYESPFLRMKSKFAA